MSSPNHKAGLAVVVPVGDIRSQPRGKVKQNALSSPRRTLSQSTTMIPGRSLSGTPTASRYTNGFANIWQSNGTSPASQSKGVPLQPPSNRVPSQQSNGTGHQQPNGAPHQKSNGLVNRHLIPARRRLLGVDEALQYSPFSSVVPFSSDIIPTPTANIHGSQPIFSTTAEQRAARIPLDFLNEELSKNQGQFNIAQHARHHLKPYLDQEVITDFIFKPTRGANGNYKKTSGSTSGHASATRVSPFADLMLQATDLTNRYPTPTSPGEPSPTPQVRPQTKHSAISPQPTKTPRLPQPQQPLPPPKIKLQTQQKQSPVPPATQNLVRNNVAYSQNGKIPANSVSASTPQQTRATPMVLIPASSAEAWCSDFVTYEEPSAKEKSESSRKPKREDEAQSGVNFTQTRDQKAASEETLRQLQDLTQDIFEAEDQSQPDGSGGLSSLNTQYFVPIFYEEHEIPTLLPAIHIKLESLLHKVATVGRFEDIPVEHLQRLQGLCEGALTSAESADLHVKPEWNEDDFTSWVSRLDAVDAGLRSARTILRIMAGGREEKQLYSEELLQGLLKVLKKVLDSCIIPIVESRGSGSSTIFGAASSHKKVISQLLSAATKVMALLTALLAKVEMAEAIVTGIEFFATPLLFVENSNSERDSVLGIQKFENLRRMAMDQIATIFSRYPDQRLFLLDEILTSLQKLPVSEKHARQYKLAEGKSIMLVSALIIQLVQTSAAQSTAANKKKRRCKTTQARENRESGSGFYDGDQLEPEGDVEDSEDSDGLDDADNPHYNTGMQKLSKDAELLMNNAAKSAWHVVNFLVQRASTTSKSGESPHRQHLDMFVQDFISVLGLPEWPASELLLQLVFVSCRKYAENPKSLAPAKNMALELLGMMGSAISNLVSTTRQSARTLESQDSEYAGFLCQMLDEYLDGSLDNSEVVRWDGPYHAIVESFQPNRSEDQQKSNAQAYYLVQWAKAASSADLKVDPKSETLALKLGKMLSGAEWSISEYVNSNHCSIAHADGFASTMSELKDPQRSIAYALTVLTMNFCRQSDYILKILLDSVTSEQITVRTRSLKSVTQMLEGDPSVLDRARNVKILIINCATDASSMVRDTALTLIGKCITLRPALEQEFLRHILRLTDDPAAGVRKRSMKMLKDIYLRNTDKNIKTAIGDSLLQRAQDLDAGVSDLARQTFEDIWLSPFWNAPDLTDASAQNKVDLRNQTSLIVGTVRRGEKVASVLVHLLKEILSNNAKNAAGNFKVCKSIVATAFDIMIDNFQDAERLEQRHILQTLTIFATANANLFTPDQLQSLQPYVANLSGKDDLEVFRSVVIIFRCVLPALPNVQHGLLREIQKALVQSISKLGKAELNEVADCLWTINGTLQNPEMLLRLNISVLKNLHNMRNTTLADSNQIDDLKRVKKYVQIAGYFGKHCDFEEHSMTFHNSLTWWKGRSVAGLIVESIHPFTASSQPLSLRAEAFDSIGVICQSWPYQFTQEHISNAFQGVLREGEAELQNIVLSSFRDFFARIDCQAEVQGPQNLQGVNASSGEKLGGSMTANEGDGASALIAQHFLKDILSIALASQDASALTATEVIASINRQGLVHPKESGPALVALETSTNPAIADVAFQEHRLLHQQHESMFEREYMRAIQEAFRYQKEIVKETLGYTINARSYASKLSAMFDIIKTSKGKYQKKFLSNFCSKVDFDLLKMDLSGTPPNVLQFSRFLTENLAFFDYGRLDELLHTISCMEKIVADTGSGIAHSINTDVFHITVESMPEAQIPGSSQDQGSAQTLQPVIDPLRLFQLTTASIILSSLWESRTYLRRLYGLSTSQQRREGKNKAASKDLSKAPSRVQGVTGDKLLATIAEKVNSLDNEDLMIQQCKDFVELLSVDSEVKVAAEVDEDLERPETPSGDEERDTPMSGGSKGVKRKSSVSIAGTPMKKKRGRPSMKRRKSGKSIGSDEDWD